MSAKLWKRGYTPDNLMILSIYALVIGMSFACDEQNQTLTQKEALAEEEKNSESAEDIANNEAEAAEDSESESSVSEPSSTAPTNSNSEQETETVDPDPPPAPECEIDTSESRIRYALQADVTCLFETQNRICAGGSWQDWDGSYEYASCTENRSGYSLPYTDTTAACSDFALNQERVCAEGSCAAWPGTAFYESCIDLADFTGSFENDSVGGQARFHWKNTSGWTGLKIGYSRSLLDLMQWNGSNESALAGIHVALDYGDCTANGLDELGTTGGSLFNSTQVGDGDPLLVDDSCAFNLIAAEFPGGPLQPWEKVYFRLRGINASSNPSLSSVITVAHVPEGMVYIDSESWPEDEFPKNDFPPCDSAADLAALDSCRYSFAIDKYEVYASSTAINLGTESSATDYPSTFDYVVFSGIGKDPARNVSFFGFKQGCLNRSYESAFSAFVDISDLSAPDRFSVATPNPLRKFHLVMPRSWLIASKGIDDLDSDCNITGGVLADTGDYSDCRSFYGAYDMLGNLWEMNNQLWNTQSSPETRNQFHGTEFNASTESIDIPSGFGQFVADFDFTLGIPTTVQSTNPGTFSDDKYWFGNQAQSLPITGGHTDGINGGRYAQSFFESPNGTGYTGARCSLLAPY